MISQFAKLSRITTLMFLWCSANYALLHLYGLCRNTTNGPQENKNSREQTFVGYSQPLMEIKRNLRALQHLLKSPQIRKSGRIFVGCKETGLCSGRTRTQTFQSEHMQQESGECTLSNISGNAHIPVEVKLFIVNVSRDSNSANNTLGNNHFGLTILRKRLQEILYLVRMWDWHGVPRLHGLCVTVPFEVGDYENQDDVKDYVTQRKSKTNSSITLWYATSKCKNQLPLCTDATSQDCRRLKTVTTHLRSISSRSEAALSVMTNIANVFDQFSRNSVVLRNFDPTKIFICSNLDIFMSDLSDLAFVTYEKGGHSSGRLLSGTFCKYSRDCPGMTWSKKDWQYQHMDRCSEPPGLCGKDNLCWGIDSSTYGCVLAPWLFSRLRSVVTAFWPRDQEITEIIRCPVKYYPEDRCDWSYLRAKLTRLRDFAAKELVGT